MKGLSQTHEAVHVEVRDMRSWIPVRQFCIIWRAVVDGVIGENNVLLHFRSDGSVVG